MRFPDQELVRRCPQLGCAVDTGSTEGRCREIHGCEQRVCPLAEVFAPPRQMVISRMLASALAMWRLAAG